MLLSAPVYFFRVTQPVDSDFGGHVGYAEYFLQNGFFEPSPAAHPILHLLMIAISKLSGGLFGLYASTMIIQVLAQGSLGGIIYYWLENFPTRKWEIWRIIAAISVTFLAPAMIMAIYDGLFYYGNIAISNYTDPTVNLLKPFALLCVIQAVKLLENQNADRWQQILLSSLLVIISTFIKPNFIIAFLPALTVISAFRLLTKKPINVRHTLLGFLVPGAISLVLQWVSMYASKSPGNKIEFAPFFTRNLLFKVLGAKIYSLNPFCHPGSFCFQKTVIQRSNPIARFAVFCFWCLSELLFRGRWERLIARQFSMDWSNRCLTFYGDHHAKTLTLLYRR